METNEEHKLICGSFENATEEANKLLERTVMGWRVDQMVTEHVAATGSSYNNTICGKVIILLKRKI
jgi:hypothetical protein